MSPSQRPTDRIRTLRVLKRPTSNVTQATAGDSIWYGLVTKETNVPKAYEPPERGPPANSLADRSLLNTASR